jgi:hypothetical protein
MKTYAGLDVFLISPLAGIERLNSCFCRFTPGKRSPFIHWLLVWMDPRTGLDAVERRKISPYRVSNTDFSVVQPVASRSAPSGCHVYPKELTALCYFARIFRSHGTI